jgi:hypothetical protein
VVFAPYGAQGSGELDAQINDLLGECVHQSLNYWPSNYEARMKGIYRAGGGRKKFVGEKLDVE